MTFNLLVCLGFVCIGAFQVVQHAGSAGGWICVVFFGLCSAVFAASFNPHAAYLQIQNEGFIVCSLFRKSPMVRWEEVSSFRVARPSLGGHRMVVYDWLAPSNSRLRRVNRRLIGATDALPESYGLRLEELTELLNAWRQRALTSG